jgi:hypothetical protein
MGGKPTLQWYRKGMDPKIRLRIFKVATVVVSVALAAATLRTGASWWSVSGFLFLAWMIAPGVAPYFVVRKRPSEPRFVAMGLCLILFAITAIAYYDLIGSPPSGGVSFAPIFLPLYHWAGFVTVLLMLAVVEWFADRRTGKG